MAGLSAKYDKLVLESIGDKYIEKESFYYNLSYESVLKEILEEKNLLNKFSKEINPTNSKRPKMLSVASSSRLGFLYGLENNVVGFETTVSNSRCRPNFDNYDEENKIYLEYKCHEFTCRTKEHNQLLAETYKTLVPKHFPGIDFKPENLGMTFGVDMTEPFFDLKQFVCHILGLLSKASKTDKVTLQYVAFVPDEDLLKDNVALSKWMEKLKSQINTIFEKFKKKQVKDSKGNEGHLEEFITLSEVKYVEVAKINDIVLERL